MSELIRHNDNRATIRWKLLTGASALALTAYVSSASIARADDSGRPQIWIELGGQLSSLKDGQETFAPDFPNSPPRPSIFSPSQKFERPPLFSIDEDGKISFQPDDSNWIFSASVQYGRSSSKRHVHQQTYPKSKYSYYYSSSNPGIRKKKAISPLAARFTDTRSQNSERHLILDFQAGKDIGLGLFGSKDATSTLSMGVRFAQFRSKSTIALKSDPDWHFKYTYLPTLVTAPSIGFTSSKIVYGQGYHSNAASLRAQRSFRGVGPSLSWSASVPIAGNTQDGSIDVDWSMNAAMLFGKQKTKTHHQTTGRYHTPAGTAFSYAEDPHDLQLTYQGPAHPDHTRSRNITVPNVGGSIGLTWHLQDFKMSFGYKADFFFNAMDGGIDARKDENRAFYGPYASISIGLGD